MEDHQVGRRGLVTDQVCSVIVSIRVGLQDFLEVGEEFRDPELPVRHCTLFGGILLIFVVLLHRDGMMNVAGLQRRRRHIQKQDG